MVLYIYYKLRYRFWSIQPVFHIHNLRYWIKPIGIINKEKFKITKFYDYSIKTYKYNDIPNDKRAMMVAFIKSNFLPNKHEKYDPTTNGIVNYYECHATQPLISIKYDNIFKKSIASYMSSVPITFNLNGNKLDMHYVDYLCVHKNKRKQGMAPKIIYSHVINSEQYNRLYLFKAEGRSTMIVPLTIYNNYMFDTTIWPIKKRYKNKPIKIIKINSSNYKLFIELIDNIYKNFKYIIMLNHSNIKHLCDNGILYIYILMYNNKAITFYIFKNNFTTYNGDKSIELCGSSCNIEHNLFTYGFLCSYNKLKDILGFKYIFIENISNNNIILKHILNRYEPLNIIPTKYYLYNYAHMPIYSKNLICIV
tara:strand:+ start:300 stop:1394 length:1095 start_codon:yes stop_codon:yes gene_type:complete